MADSLWQSWLLLLPVILAGIAHMVIVTHNYLPKLAIPLNQRCFGKNKTWRGFLVVPTISMLVAPLCFGDGVDLSLSLQAGWATGLGYMLFELPNSALKRRLGVAPGQLPTRYRAAFIFLDQADSGTGVALACMLVLKLNLKEGLQLFGLFIISAMLIKNGLYKLSLKKSRF